MLLAATDAHRAVACYFLGGSDGGTAVYPAVAAAVCLRLLLVTDVRFGTASIPIPGTSVRFDTNSIPVPDTSVGSVRPLKHTPDTGMPFTEIPVVPALIG